MSLRPFCPLAADQGDLGSCVAHAVVAALHVLDARAGRMGRSLDSALGLYHATRALRGTPDADDGSTIEESLRAAQCADLWSVTAWPNDPACFAEPLPGGTPRWPHRRVVNYGALAQDPVTLRWTLACGVPVVVGLKVFASFRDEAAWRTGRVRMPNPGEPYVGGHAVLLDGYSMSRGVYGFLNSYGTGYGDEGFGEIDANYVHDPWLCTEIQAVRALREIE